MTRIALAHLDLSAGPQAANLAKLTLAVERAALAGARWLVTPEMAVQGYFFWDEATRPGILVQPAPEVRAVIDRAAGHGLGLFLCCAGRDADDAPARNGCLVFGPDGTLLGGHHKTRKIGPAEAWSTPGETLHPIDCPGFRAGVLICADSWLPDHALTLRDQGAAVIVVPAAWPPGQHGPDGCWERGSAASGLPYWVCNQTGAHPRLDFRAAVSTVIVQGEARLSHCGLDDTVLLFDWNFARAETPSARFETLPLSPGRAP